MHVVRTGGVSFFLLSNRFKFLAALLRMWETKAEVALYFHSSVLIRDSVG